MSRSPQSASFLARSGLFTVLALFASALCCTQLPAQSSAPASAPATTQAMPDILPAAPSPVAASVPSTASTAALVPGLFSRASALRQPWTPAPALGASANPFEAGSSPLVPFQSAPSFGSFVPPEGFGMSFNTAPAGLSLARPGAGALGFGRMSAGGFSPFTTAGMGGRPGPLMPMRSGPNGSLAAGPQGFAGPVPWSLFPTNESLRGTFSLPLGSSASSLHFTYQAALAPSGAFSSLDFRKMINTGIYTSPDLGNGVHFSAGTGYNAKSVAGARKPTGPSVNIKLTF